MIYLASLTEQTADKINGYTIIGTKEELDIIVANNNQANRVIIRRDFAEAYFTPSGLQKFIQNVKSVNRNLIMEIDEGSEVLTEDVMINKIKSARNLDEMLIVMTTYPKEFLDSIKVLTAKHSKNQDELLAAASNVSRLQSIIDSLREENDNLKHAVSIEVSNKCNAQAKFDALSKRINFQYNAGVDESKLFVLDSNSYDKVIYIKEITRVQYVDSLVYYLKEILKILYGMPTRHLVIESYYSYGKSSLYPNLVPHYTLKEKDVISGDILMCGLQPKLMGDILKNPSGISVLVVLDRGGYEMPHIKGDNVEYIYTASDIKDVPKNIPKSRVISYSEDTLYIPLIGGFDELDSGERITKYSSTTIMKSLIALIEGR